MEKKERHRQRGRVFRTISDKRGEQRRNKNGKAKKRLQQQKQQRRD